MTDVPYRAPSGLFPAGPPRPRYREPHPVRGGAVALGMGVTALWMLLFGLLATSIRGYGWITIGSGGAAWLLALVLARRGDRGVAAGIAITTAIGWAIGSMVLAAAWAAGNWPLW